MASNATILRRRQQQRQLPQPPMATIAIPSSTVGKEDEVDDAMRVFSPPPQQQQQQHPPEEQEPAFQAGAPLARALWTTATSSSSRQVQVQVHDASVASSSLLLSQSKQQPQQPHATTQVPRSGVAAITAVSSSSSSSSSSVERNQTNMEHSTCSTAPSPSSSSAAAAATKTLPLSTVPTTKHSQDEEDDDDVLETTASTTLTTSTIMVTQTNSSEEETGERSVSSSSEEPENDTPPHSHHDASTSTTTCSQNAVVDSEKRSSSAVTAAPQHPEQEPQPQGHQQKEEEGSGTTQQHQQQQQQQQQQQSSSCSGASSSTGSSPPGDDTSCQHAEENTEDDQAQEINNDDDDYAGNDDDEEEDYDDDPAETDSNVTSSRETSQQHQQHEPPPTQAPQPPQTMELDWSFLRAGHLYDRDAEMEHLRAALCRQFDGPNGNGDDGGEQQQQPSFVVVSGLSGTGKSALARAALKPLVKERHGYYLTGKFDQLQHISGPYAPFVNAINDYVYYVLKQEQQQQQQQQTPNNFYYHQGRRRISSAPLSIVEALQTELLSVLSPEGCALLLHMIPALSHILHMDNNSRPNSIHVMTDPDEVVVASEEDQQSLYYGATNSHDSQCRSNHHSYHNSNHNNMNYNATTSVWEASLDRLKVIFRRFLRVICKPERPCVLVLDDLQWADASSLDLMESLICDLQTHNQKGLFLVGICRSNEISVDHKLAALLRRLEDEQHARIDNIVVRNLTFHATNQLICDVLKQPWDICVPLTEIIHGQTKGNVFYVMNYIKALYADRVLIPDLEYGTGGWLWDGERWQMLYSKQQQQQQQQAGSRSNYNNSDRSMRSDDSAASNNSITGRLSPMVDLIVRQLRRLPDQTQLVLRTCACIGAEIDVALAEKILVDIDIPAVIHVAVKEGLLVVLERRHGQITTNSLSSSMHSLLAAAQGDSGEAGGTCYPASRYYMFAHDGIQQAAYSLIPENRKSATHLSIGRMLFKNMRSMEEFSENIFVIVNQMNRGMTHIRDQSERDGLAALCLKAGNRAILSSDFHTAVQYFVVGTTLLAQTPDYWHRQYELSLELYNSLAEADYCVADFDMMDVAVLEVLHNALSFRDMVRAYATQVYALGARFMLQEAIDLGLQVLERFDEDFPDTTPKRKSCRRPFSSPMKLKRILGWKTKSQLLYMPDMNDSDKLAAMGILNLLTTYSLIGRPSLFPFIATRLVKLSLEHGLCAISAPGFAFYGLWLCSIGDVRSGYRYGTLALDILERYQNTITEWVPRVYSVFYGWIAPWKQPLRSTFAPTLHAHRVGLETGDIEYSMIGAHVYSMNAFFAGVSLNELEVEMRKFVDLMNKHKQGPWAAATSVQLQMIHNLIGKSDDPMVLRGEIMTDEKVREIATVQNMENYETYFVQVMVWSLLLAYHFGNLKQALATANDCREAIKDFGSSFLVSIQYFYDGMTALGAAANPKYEASKAAYLKIASRALKKLKKVAKDCPENSQQKVFLMQAEFAAVSGDLDQAMGYYAKSISWAGENGFIQDEALANERAGITLWHASNNPKANIHLSRALDLYRSWGAEAKCNQLRNLHFHR